MKNHTIIGGVNGVGKSSFTGASMECSTDMGMAMDVERTSFNIDVDRLMKVMSEIMSEKYGCKVTMTAIRKETASDGDKKRITEENLNTFINRAINEAMERDNAATGPQSQSISK